MNENRPVIFPVPRVVALLALGFVLVAAQGGGVARADDASDARRHAQRASALAAAGKCKQAVAEYDKALAILRDPALLFNRGECHRKLGDPEAAIDDYKQFLSDLPNAPNRADVEKKIAALSHKTPGAGAAPAATDNRSAGSAAAGETRVAPASGAAASARPAAAAPAATAAVAAAPASPREVILEPRPPASAAGSDGTAGDHPGTDVSASAQGEPASGGTGSAADGGLTSRPWFWIAIAVVAVGAGVGTFVLLNRDGTTVPSSALGNYKF